jgi:hypothetical protein
MLIQQHILFGIICVAGLASLDAAIETHVIYSASSVAEKIVGTVQSQCKICSEKSMLESFDHGSAY